MKTQPLLKPTFYWLFLLVFLPFAGFAQDDAIHHFETDVPEYQVGADTIQGTITILNKNGRVDREFSGKQSFVIGKQFQELAFEGGKANFQLAVDKSQYIIAMPVQEKEITSTNYVRIVPPWTSILPPLISILLALLIKEVVISLLTGILFGLLLINGFTPGGFLESLLSFVDEYLINVLSNQSHLSIIVFSLLIGGMVGIISKNGGMTGLVNLLKQQAYTIRRTKFVTWLIGLLIFFDDYANTLIVGNTMRPLTDRFKISREKLAYIVDSTAAPIASVAFITTWIGAQLDYIQGATESLPITQSAYAIFFNSLQYAFYPVLTILFVFFLILSGRDYGPMYQAEVKGREREEEQDTESAGQEEAIMNQNLWDAILPLISLISVAFGALIYTGYSKEVWKDDAKSFVVKIAETIGQSDPYAALLWASFLSLLLAFALTVARRTFNAPYTVDLAIDGFKSMLSAIIILILAWTLASLTDQLQTSEFLAHLFTGKVAPGLFPAIIFVLAALVSFSTGSSWGTMAILYPLVLPLTYQSGIASGLEHEASMEIFYHVVSVVLAGSVLGDHCSPISDTTILSSLASDCNHIQHVRTQLPYALTVGFISLVLGHVMTGMNLLPLYVSYPLAIGLLYVVIRYWFGKLVPEKPA